MAVPIAAGLTVQAGPHSTTLSSSALSCPRHFHNDIFPPSRTTVSFQIWTPQAMLNAGAFGRGKGWSCGIALNGSRGPQLQWTIGVQLDTRRKQPFKILATLVEFSPDDFSVERLLGTYGFMNVSSIIPGSVATPEMGAGMDENKAAGYDLREVNRMAGQEMGQGSVEIRLYKGRIATAGKRLGTRVILKAYPGRLTGGPDADTMAANELLTHALLQERTEDSNEVSPHVSVLLGGFQTSTGEQWLVLRDDGTATAASYAQLAADATAAGTAVGEWEFLDRFDPSRPILRRRRFIVELLRGAVAGLAFMHSRGRLHQSLGPASVVLNTVEERDPQILVPRLRDFAFSVDVSDAAILEGPSASGLWGRGGTGAPGPMGDLAEGLWRRAAAAGARLPMERKAFAIADDIYAAGLLVAYMAFVPLAQPGSIDGPSLQRLLETTFRLDLRAAREYCSADDRWIEAVKFLDAGEGAGWDLLQAMLNPEYRQRPTAATVLKHPFLTRGGF